MSSSFPATRFTILPLGRENDTTGPGYKETNPATLSEEPSDEVLIARICADDSEALGLLFRRYARLVWTIAHRILRNKEEADDLLQDLFLLIRRRATAFDSSKGTVRSLLIQMCYQRAFSRRRDLARQHFYTSAEVTENTVIARLSLKVPFYDESLEAHFGKIGLRRALKDLTEKQWDTLRLCFAEGYTLEEIAVKQGQSYGNVRHNYYRGLAKLRKHLKGNDL